MTRRQVLGNLMNAINNHRTVYSSGGSFMSVISSRHGRTFPKFPTFKACKNSVISCDGLLYDLLWRVSLRVLKINKIVVMVTYLNDNPPNV